MIKKNPNFFFFWEKKSKINSTSPQQRYHFFFFLIKTRVSFVFSCTSQTLFCSHSAVESSGNPKIPNYPPNPSPNPKPFYILFLPSFFCVMNPPEVHICLRAPVPMLSKKRTVGHSSPLYYCLVVRLSASPFCETCLLMLDTGGQHCYL